ncbi:MAG: DNA repair protein RecN [Candidatus Omnitrophica bacterium]|nr:DNA repair protein RecN [Candidatus Omnitrophota bacterium]
MLSQLLIQNFGLIDRIEIEFSSGLNVFTGETGAGKSILIDALRFALGERFNTAYVRDADKPCIVEAVFDLSEEVISSCPFLSEYISSDDTVFIINRTYMPEGRNKVKVNGFSLTVSQLKDIGDHLVDFHGPNDHQMLLSDESHISILDRLADLDKEKNVYAREYERYSALRKELKELQDLAESSERETDILTHQIRELEQVSLDDEEYESVKAEITRMNNSEKLVECVRDLIDILDNEQTGAGNAISRAFGPMNTLNATDSSTEELAETLGRMQEDASLIVTALNRYLEELSFDEELAREVNDRYDTYYQILSKYGPSLEDAREFYEKSREKYDRLVDIEHNDAELRKEISSSENALEKEAGKMTSKRRSCASSLKGTIEKELKQLGIKHVDFDCRIEKTEFTPTGCDRISFYISPNAGEKLKPLSEIVSSGEAARLMLALKKALTKVDPIPVLIFDEIDSQIGGRLGQITGQKLKDISHDRQVLLITHLPQIASFGDRHFKVSKKVENSRTLTGVTTLEGEARIRELADMMSGEMQNLIAVKHAQDMLARAKK